MHAQVVFTPALALLIPFGGCLVWLAPGRWRQMGGVALWLGSYALVLAQTRSAWLALAAAVLTTTVRLSSGS